MSQNPFAQFAKPINWTSVVSIIPFTEYARPTSPTYDVGESVRTSEFKDEPGCCTSK